jgi:hypothetical protein
LVFDFTAKGSSAEDLARERAVRVLPPGQEHKASDLWRLLIERSIQVAASGGERTREELHRDFADSFQFAPLKRHHEALLRLEELSRQVLDDIETRVAGSLSISTEPAKSSFPNFLPTAAERFSLIILTSIEKTNVP